MDKTTREHLDNLHSEDPQLRYTSFQFIINLTNQPVDWAYDIWDDLLTLTKTGDNHKRTIAVQLLSNLAKSDPEQKLLNDLGELMKVTKDEKFVTARHSLQCLWKIGIVNDNLKAKLVTALNNRFKECIIEKNCNLIRYDIVVLFRKIFDINPDEKLKATALKLIQTEEDEKYQKKYLGVWKDLMKIK